MDVPNVETIELMMGDEVGSESDQGWTLPSSGFQELSSAEREAGEGCVVFGGVEWDWSGR